MIQYILDTVIVPLLQHEVLRTTKAAAVVIIALGLAAPGSHRIHAHKPSDAAARMTVAPGFEVQLVAAEPLVRQPVCIEFDDRGRLWVIQYLQYPNPAGLKRVQVDRYSRTTYDRVPEPPPHGPRGADRITILSDTDGDGRMDQGHEFVAGLNLATGLAFGHGGVFVLNVPYLLFYPDRDPNDVPDSDPEVLLSGFGMEDAHSVANSLTWGPDGWLYGCQGSTVTAKVRGVEFQQGVWRYHPQTRDFELYCEGGGNSWGLDFDSVGRLFYSTNWGGNTLLHGVQGGYYVKAFAKHGALHNRHAYGYFEHAPHQNFRGGHVTVGGIVYQGDIFPEHFRGQYIASDLLGHAVYWHKVEPRGSTVGTAHGGELLIANDTWFAPTDVTLGPDGAVYVSDWHDARTAHPDPDAEWDRSNGRIYRIAPAGRVQPPAIDLAKLSTDELLKLHQHRNQWFVRRARQELVRRGEGSILQRLKDTAISATAESQALEALWTLYCLDGFDEPLAFTLLNSPHAAIRAWTVRFLGDAGRVSPEMAHRLDELAEQEPSVDVRQQLACSAARFPADQALPIINANINRDVDNDDPFMPLLWWWAVERHSVGGREEVMRRFIRPSLWKSRLGRDTLLTRLTRRYAAEGTMEGLNCVVRLLNAAPDSQSRQILWPAILQGWQDSPDRGDQNAQMMRTRDHELSRLILSEWKSRPRDMSLLQLCLLLQHREPFDAALREAFDRQAELPRRLMLLPVLGRTADQSLIEHFLKLIVSDEPETIRIAAVQSLSRFDDERIAATLMRVHQSSSSANLASQIRDVLLGRRSWAKAWVLAVERGEIKPTATPIEQIRRVALLGDPELDELVARHWGKLQPATREEKLAEVRRLNNDLRAAAGNATAGRAVFKKHCAACHQLFGEGTKLGPDLTTANRRDRDFLLISLVDSSSVIRKEYVSIVVETRDGRVLTGLAVSRDDSAVTLVNAKNEKLVVGSGEIEHIYESPVSIMPDDLYRQLKPDELRDLFAYLQSDPPQAVK